MKEKKENKHERKKRKNFSFFYYLTLKNNAYDIIRTLNYLYFLNVVSLCL
jgi:hypothetical protein